MLAVSTRLLWLVYQLDLERLARIGEQRLELARVAVDRLGGEFRCATPAPEPVAGLVLALHADAEIVAAADHLAESGAQRLAHGAKLDVAELGRGGRRHALRGGADAAHRGAHGVRLVARRAAVFQEHAQVALAQPVGAQLPRVEAEVARVEDEPGPGAVLARVDQQVEQAVGALFPHAVVGAQARAVLRPVANAGGNRTLRFGERRELGVLRLGVCESMGGRQRG
jgi:hypothetical protein